VAFVAKHQRCGVLDGGLDGERVWLACTCGAKATHPTTSLPPAPARARPGRRDLLHRHRPLGASKSAGVWRFGRSRRRRG